MIVGCYTLDLYCDNADSLHTWHELNAMPHQFTGDTRQYCYRQARKKGWTIND